MEDQEIFHRKSAVCTPKKRAEESSSRAHHLFAVFCVAFARFAPKHQFNILNVHLKQINSPCKPSFAWSTVQGSEDGRLSDIAHLHRSSVSARDKRLFSSTLASNSHPSHLSDSIGMSCPFDDNHIDFAQFSVLKLCDRVRSMHIVSNYRRFCHYLIVFHPSLGSVTLILALWVVVFACYRPNFSRIVIYCCRVRVFRHNFCRFLPYLILILLIFRCIDALLRLQHIGPSPWEVSSFVYLNLPVSRPFFYLLDQ